LSFGTEPLLHRHFLDFLTILKQYETYAMIYTNGMLLTEQLSEQIVRMNGLGTIAISMDGATKQTYERIRVGGKFDQVLANIAAFNRVKRRLGPAGPELSFIFVLMRSNITELPALIRLAHDLRVGSVGAVHMVPYAFEHTDTKAESLEQHKALCNRMLDEARAAAKKYKIRVTLPDNFAEAPAMSLVGKNNDGVFHLPVCEDEVRRTCCQFPWHWVGIDPRGYVNPCGWWYSEQPMGNIRTESFEDIWDNALYRALRAEHLSGALRATCQTCPAGGLGNVNNPNAFLVKKPTGPAFLG
jgi:radical SAM protein with 4Fe4S-binding SPASM domain